MKGLGILPAALAALWMGGALAQGQPQLGLGVTRLASNLYRLSSGCGALVGPDGVFLVDSGSAGYSDQMIAEIREISNAPIRFLVNTNARHTGGNESLANLGAIILGPPGLRERMLHPAFSPGEMATLGPAVPAALPTITFDAPITFRMNGEEIRVIPIPHALTEGDTMVQFVNADVILTGDSFQSVAYPNIDRNNGGSLKGLLDGLNLVIAMAGPGTRIVPSRDKIADRGAVVAQRDMIVILRERVAAMIQQGRSEKEVIDANLNADYPSSRLGPNRFIRALYEDLVSAK